jgi:undecaprenyl-diphosphatase
MDRAALLALNGLRPSSLDGVLGFVADWGLYAFPLALVVLLAVRRDRASGVALRGGWLSFSLALLASDTILKPLIRRARPTADAALRAHLHVLGHAPPAGNFSMPSGAAAACGASAAWVWLRFGPRWGVAASLFALCVGASRVYAGLHWPSDLVVGYALGAAVALGVERFERWLG